MLKLLGCGSPNVFKVQLMLAEVGLDYEFEDVPLFGPALASPELRALAPNGRLPVLIDDGVPIFESGAILIHLAEKTGRFLPTEPEPRSRVMQWLMWQMAGVGPMLGQAMHFRYSARPDSGQGPGDGYAPGRFAREAARLYDVAEARLAQVPWLAGDDYSIADIAAFPWLGRYAASLGIDLGTRPHVGDWIARIEARPACRIAAPLAKALHKRGLAAMATASDSDRDRFFGR